MSSEAQINANRANALHSTGPKSSDGKAKSSLNAVKTGLTGRTVLLPGDDGEAYQKHVQRFFTEHKPAGDAEHNLVQSVADTEWRLLRIPSLEMGVYALGRLEFAEKFAAERDEAVRNALIEAQTFLTYQRQLNNLSIQEIRLRRQREKDLADLKELQTKHRQDTNQQVARAVQLYREAEREGKPFDPAAFGFEISMQQIHERIAENKRLHSYKNEIDLFLSRKGPKAA
jgi:hypothetical protein